MKLSLAFVAFAAAADSQAPVISLNLERNMRADRHTAGQTTTPEGGGDPITSDTGSTYQGAGPTKKTMSTGAQNSFADECEVPVNQHNVVCQEPVASAYDHHDGDISGSIHTVYTLFVKSDVKKSPVKSETHATQVNLDQRGEWVITYDVTDDAGNAAEQVQFALIMIDTEAPSFDNAPSTITQTKCTGKADCYPTETPTTPYISKDPNNSDNLFVELCTGNENVHFLLNGVALAATDKYDGSLDQTNSKMAFKLSTDGGSTFTNTNSNNYAASSDGFQDSTTFGAATAQRTPKVYHYDIYTADFADIFGESNENNAHSEDGTVTVRDTIIPTVVFDDADANYADEWECGYPAHNYRATTKDKQYDDCYDDHVGGVTAGQNIQGVTEIEMSCKGTVTGNIDAAVMGYETTVDTTISDTQKQCLGLNGFGGGKINDDTDHTHLTSSTAGRGNSDISYGTKDGTKHTVTLTYKVKDLFGNQNAAGETREVDIVDTIAPTLYITAKNIREAGYTGGEANTCELTHDDKCKCLHTDGSWSDVNKGDYTTSSCVQTHHVSDDKTTVTATYEHNYDGDVGSAGSGITEGDSAYTSELTIQHSAGYAQDYKYVQELMEEGNGFGCYDKCSSTTTSVEWQNAGCGSTAEASEFNMLKPGTYYLKYECKDESANTATACRTFINVDKTRPVITVLQAANDADGVWTVEASRDNNYVDAGATCSDMVDGNISQDVEVSGDVVNMAAVGTYRINYNCEDSAGQTAVQATRTVIVQDKTCPTCTVPGGNTKITVEASFPYTEEQSTCTDTLDGAMPNAHVYNTVDVEQTGTYVLTYSVTDKNGNGRSNYCKAKNANNAADVATCSAIEDAASNDHLYGSNSCVTEACATSCSGNDACEIKTDSCTAAGVEGATAGATSHFTKTVIVEDTMIPIISLKYRGTPLVGMMAESSTTTVNGWVIGAVASAVSGVALLGYAATRKATVATSVPV